MLKLIIAFCVVINVAVSDNVQDIPSWITDTSGFKHPQEIDSVKDGKGSLESSFLKDEGWLIHLNERAGHGVDISFEEVKLKTNLNEFLLISAWPLNKKDNQIQLYAGTHQKTLKPIFLPNTKTFFILFSSSQGSSSKIKLSYKRYGNSFESSDVTTENPFKKKEKRYEIQLKGKSPDDYADFELLKKLKVALRASAKRFCTAHDIPFNDNVNAQEMVSIHRISYCPFEWPERNICASIEHSIYVSGDRMAGGDMILNYELTADNLKLMWLEDNFRELFELGITVFELPSTDTTIVYWSLVIGLIIGSSLLAIYIFWKASQVHEVRFRAKTEEFKQVKRPKFKLAKHQEIPAFMYNDSKESKIERAIAETAENEINFRHKFRDDAKAKETPELPIGNYLGSILFSSNKAFEDDEDNTMELKPMTPQKPDPEPEVTVYKL